MSSRSGGGARRGIARRHLRWRAPSEDDGRASGAMRLMTPIFEPIEGEAAPGGRFAAFVGQCRDLRVEAGHTPSSKINNTLTRSIADDRRDGVRLMGAGWIPLLTAKSALAGPDRTSQEARERHTARTKAHGLRPRWNPMIPTDPSARRRRTTVSYRHARGPGHDKARRRPLTLDVYDIVVFHAGAGAVHGRSRQLPLPSRPRPATVAGVSAPTACASGDRGAAAATCPSRHVAHIQLTVHRAEP